MEQINVKLAEVVSDITGLIGMSIIEAILGGERDPVKLAKLRDQRCHCSEDQIALALQGTWRPEHLFELRQAYELVFDEQKTYQDPRRPTKPTHLRGQTPAGVEQELYALSLGHFVVRALMLEAAQRENLDVDRLSFTGCLQILQARLPECDNTTPQRLDQWYQLPLAELAQERLEPRRNRVNPRAVKRKMSKFAKKRPEHRGRPPMKKTFAETVLIT